MTYFRHATSDDLTLLLRLINPTTQFGVTGASPTVQIRRHRTAQGGSLLDNHYWDGADFVATPTLLPMAELDDINSPGHYIYFFEQSLVAANIVYFAYFLHTDVPSGFDIEEHIFSDDELSQGSPFDPTGVLP